MIFIRTCRQHCCVDVTACVQEGAAFIEVILCHRKPFARP